MSSVVSTSSYLTRRRRRFWPSLPPTTGERNSVVLDPNRFGLMDLDPTEQKRLIKELIKGGVGGGEDGGDDHKATYMLF
jgi:hypothetical protein